MPRTIQYTTLKKKQQCLGRGGCFSNLFFPSASNFSLLVQPRAKPKYIFWCTWISLFPSRVCDVSISNYVCLRTYRIRNILESYWLCNQIVILKFSYEKKLKTHRTLLAYSQNTLNSPILERIINIYTVQGSKNPMTCLCSRIQQHYVYAENCEVTA